MALVLAPGTGGAQGHIATTSIATDRPSVALSSVVVPRLAQVRHESSDSPPNPFGISSGDRRVCTTFGMRIEVFRQAEVELVQQGFLFRGRFGDTP